PLLSRFRQLIAAAERTASCDGGMRCAFPPYTFGRNFRNPPEAPLGHGPGMMDGVRSGDVQRAGGKAKRIPPIVYHGRSPASGGPPPPPSQPAGYNPPATQRWNDEYGQSAGC